LPTPPQALRARTPRRARAGGILIVHFDPTSPLSDEPLSIHWPIIRRCLANPGAVAIVDDQRTYSRLQLLAGALILADEIDRRCKSPTVGVMLPTGGSFAVAALACWITGRTLVPLNYLLKPEELQYIVDDCGTDTVLTATPLLDFMGFAPQRVSLVKLDQVDFKSVPDPRWPALNDDEDLGVLLYTSGTSGKPKGVMLTHANIQANIEQCRRFINFDSTHTVLGVLPQFHSFGITVLTLLPLTVGAKAVYTAKFLPPRIVKLFRTHKPTAFIAIPSMLNALLHVKDAGPEDFASLKIAVSGGEPLPQAVADKFKERFNVTIAEGYGLTETAPVTNWCRPQDYKPHSVGMPLPGVRERIVDIETGLDLGPGLDGEVRITGPNVMRGYFRMPEQTKAAFDEQGYFRTGDIGRFDADGHLYITGRLKEMLIIGGENVFPREIEEVLNMHASVKDSGVVGKSDPMRGEQPVAFIELKEGATFNEQDLKTWCRGKLAGYKVPDEIRLLPALPRNPTGKVMRRELKAMLK
jgi:long-chain acyl-CoA synthetase